MKNNKIKVKFKAKRMPENYMSSPMLEVITTLNRDMSITLKTQPQTK